MYAGELKQGKRSRDLSCGVCGTRNEALAQGKGGSVVVLEGKGTGMFLFSDEDLERGREVEGRGGGY